MRSPPKHPKLSRSRLPLHSTNFVSLFKITHRVFSLKIQSIHSQDILDESWLREHAGQSQVCLRKSPTGRFIDPSDSILKIAKSLSGKKITLNEFLELKQSRTMLSGTDTYIFTKDSSGRTMVELWLMLKRFCMNMGVKNH